MQNKLITTVGAACILVISACETTITTQSANTDAPRYETGQSEQATPEQKQGFSAITKLPYPQTLDDNLNYCRENLPQAVIRKTPVSGFSDESRRCRANRCVPLHLSNGYTFVEFYHSRIENLSMSRGQYRAHLKDNTSDQCDVWNNYVTSLNESQQKYFEELIPEQCVVFDEIDDFSAQYSVRQLERTTINTEWISYRLYGSEVVEKESKLVIGNDISISVTRKDDDLSAYLSCRNDVDIYEDIIPPLK